MQFFSLQNRPNLAILCVLSDFLPQPPWHFATLSPRRPPSFGAQKRRYRGPLTNNQKALGATSGPYFLLTCHFNTLPGAYGDFQPFPKRRFGHQSHFLLWGIKGYNPGALCSVVALLLLGIMPCKTLVKNIVLVMLIADSVFGEGQSSIKCGVSSQRNLCHFFGS